MSNADDWDDQRRDKFKAMIGCKVLLVADHVLQAHSFIDTGNLVAALKGKSRHALIIGFDTHALDPRFEIRLEDDSRWWISPRHVELLYAKSCHPDDNIRDDVEYVDGDYFAGLPIT